MKHEGSLFHCGCLESNTLHTLTPSSSKITFNTVLHIIIGHLHDHINNIAGAVPGMVSSEFDARLMVDYVKFLRKEFVSSTTAGNGSSNRQGSSSPPSSTSPQESALNALGMSRLTLWNLCNNNSTSVVPPPQEPQREALNLEVREQQARALQESIVKRESDESVGPPPPKRIMSSEDNVNKHSGVAGTHIKIASRGK
jgi:hypothetical protein